MLTWSTADWLARGSELVLNQLQNDCVYHLWSLFWGKQANQKEALNRSDKMQTALCGSLCVTAFIVQSNPVVFQAWTVVNCSESSSTEVSLGVAVIGQPTYSSILSFISYSEFQLFRGFRVDCVCKHSTKNSNFSSGLARGGPQGPVRARSGGRMEVNTVGIL